MKNYIITIARGYGSGGSHIARLLSEKLSIPCYDDEIIQMASDMSGINESYFYEANEKIHKGKLAIMKSKGAYTGTLYSVNDRMYLSNENIFNYQAKVIRELALEDKQSCIIIGKAANYVIGSLNNVLRVDIQAPLEYCVRNIQERYSMTADAAREKIMETDRYRRDYYKYYTGEDWTDPVEYDISINTSLFGEEYAADMIIQCLKDKIIREN